MSRLVLVPHKQALGVSVVLMTTVCCPVFVLYARSTWWTAAWALRLAWSSTATSTVGHRSRPSFRTAPEWCVATWPPQGTIWLATTRLRNFSSEGWKT